MVNAELLRLVDSISRDKNIEKDLIFEDIETAMVSAVRKAFGQIEDVAVKIDRMTGEVAAIMDGESVSIAQLGRIPAQTAKQVIIQKIREAERGSIFEEFSKLKGQLISGTVAREERGALLVTLQGRGEGFLPRSEQIPGETHHPGERIRAMILDVREAPHQVKIVLSRTHPDLIKRLFELEVPEVAERVIELKALAREAGYRTKIAVSSIDSRVDAVGACVGVRGSRIKNIVEELGGEKIDIVRWNESSQILIGNALKPAEIQDIALCFELGRASVVVGEDQLSLAIGKRGQNVRLAARLTGWDIDIVTPAEYNKNLDEMDKTLKSISDIDDVFLAKLTAMGIVSLMDIDEIGAEPLVQELELAEELAKEIVEKSSERAKVLSVELQAAKEQAAKERAAAKAAEAASAEAPPETDSAEDQPITDSTEDQPVTDIADEQPVTDNTDDQPMAGIAEDQPVAGIDSTETETEPEPEPEIETDSMTDPGTSIETDAASHEADAQDDGEDRTEEAVTDAPSS